jgi:hypothetical protein
MKALTDDSDEDKARSQAMAQQKAMMAQAEKKAEPQGALATSPMVAEADAVRRARLAAMNRKGRASTVLSQGTAVTPAYSNTVLG